MAGNRVKYINCLLSVKEYEAFQVYLGDALLARHLKEMRHSWCTKSGKLCVKSSWCPKVNQER